MKCSFCGHDFDLDEAELGCRGCPLAVGCHLVRCPRCGYETLPDARLIEWMRKLYQRVADHLFLARTGRERVHKWMRSPTRRTTEEA
jgi:DNA-directed RNA polymerase subunit RPC12/RpoP